jgi:hypothetical protein
MVVKCARERTIAYPCSNEKSQLREQGVSSGGVACHFGPHLGIWAGPASNTCKIVGDPALSVERRGCPPQPAPVRLVASAHLMLTQVRLIG